MKQTNKSCTQGKYQKSCIPNKTCMFGDKPSECNKISQNATDRGWAQSMDTGFMLKCTTPHRHSKFAKSSITGWKKPAEACVTVVNHTWAAQPFYFCVWRYMSPIAVITYISFCLCMNDNTCIYMNSILVCFVFRVENQKICQQNPSWVSFC